MSHFHRHTSWSILKRPFKLVVTLYYDKSKTFIVPGQKSSRYRNRCYDDDDDVYPGLLQCLIVVISNTTFLITIGSFNPPVF